MNEGRIRKTAVAAFVGLAGILGFGSGAVVIAAQEQPTACTLLTRKDAMAIIGKAVRRETSITGTEASTCGYVAEKDAKRVVSFSVGEFPSGEEATIGYIRARANAKFDDLKIETVRRLGKRAYWIPQTNNFERTLNDQRLTFGELTVLEGRRVYTVFIAPPSKTKARDAIDLVIAD